MKNLGQMMKQAKEMQDKMQTMQAELEEKEVTGAAGGGMVEATMNGKGQLRGLKLDPAIVTPDDIEVMEDLIVAAINDARTKVDEMMADQMKGLTGGLSLPEGFKLPF